MFLLDDILHWLKGPKKIPGVMAEEIAATFPLRLICDENFLILETNPAFAHHFRLSVKGIKGKPVSQILGTDVKIIEGAAWSKGEERQISSLRDVLGKRNPKLLRGNFPKIGPRIFNLYTRRTRSTVLLALEDVTEAKDLEEKIIKSRRELLSVFDGIEDPMVMIDKNYRIRRINAAMLKAMGGNSYKGFIGKACYYKLHRRTDVCPGCTAGKTFSRGEKTSRVGLLEGLPNPEELTYQITCYPLKSADGHITGIAESYRDLTELIQTEEKLYESERSRLVESLAAGIAHEVRNPLAVIRSTAQYCLGELGEDPDMKESLEMIVRSSEVANRVLSGLLDFARPQEIDIRRYPLRPILEEGLRFIKGRAKLQKVRTVKVVSTHLPLLSFDRNRFLQAYMNLLTNSLDAMPHGGTLTVEAHPQDGHRECKIIVRDTGRGIPEVMLREVMRPFYTTKKDGVGLGLPIAEGIIRSHGGRMTFRSRQGKETEVTIFLPVRGRRPRYEVHPRR